MLQCEPHDWVPQCRILIPDCLKYPQYLKHPKYSNYPRARVVSEVPQCVPPDWVASASYTHTLITDCLKYPKYLEYPKYPRRPKDMPAVSMPELQC